MKKDLMLAVLIAPCLAFGARAQSAAPATTTTNVGPAPGANAVQSQPSGGRQKFRLEDGAPVKLRLQQTVSSAEAQVNDKIEFDVLEELAVNGIIIVPKGGVAWGTVTEAQPKRRMARGGKLNVNIDAVRLVDGEKAALRAVKDVKGGGHTGAMTGAIVATSIVFFPAAPLFLFMHGKDITIPKGTEITAFVNCDLNLDPAKFAVKPSDALATSPTLPDSIALTVKSTPDGADITVDGKYAGSTPSVLRLAGGDHTVSIGKSGFAAWQRTVTLSAGASITVDASLEKNQ